MAFPTGWSGVNPRGQLALKENTLFGTTWGGGQGYGGTAFAINLSPVAHMHMLTNGTVNVEWTAIPNCAYQLQYTTNIARGDWRDLGGPVIATNETANAGDIIRANTQRFYRVQLLPTER
jgi:hypothetical protein